KASAFPGRLQCVVRLVRSWWDRLGPPAPPGVFGPPPRRRRRTLAVSGREKHLLFPVGSSAWFGWRGRGGTAWVHPPRLELWAAPTPQAPNFVFDRSYPLSVIQKPALAATIRKARPKDVLGR
ncbi:MAG: hypothetical protein AB7N91_25435, partial [Candidatus Tectimicrobiota bacterium]